MDQKFLNKGNSAVNVVNCNNYNMYNEILSIGKTNIECQSLDVVIFSLSLIGKNWQEYIVEAKRCLSTKGSYFIVVTTNELNERRRLHYF